MVFRSLIPPLCRACGKHIAKSTRNVYVKKERSPYDRDDDFSRYHYGILRSKADCERATNQRVLHVSYWTEGEDRRVNRFSEWDGASYVDDFFCTNNCSMSYARMCAQSPNNMCESKRYVEARKRQISEIAKRAKEINHG